MPGFATMKLEYYNQGLDFVKPTIHLQKQTLSEFHSSQYRGSAGRPSLSETKAEDPEQPRKKPGMNEMRDEIDSW